MADLHSRIGRHSRIESDRRTSSPITVVEPTTEMSTDGWRKFQSLESSVEMPSESALELMSANLADVFERTRSVSDLK